ncbi:MAG TPA: 50S ribosomal protein L10 [Acidimicrobiales bacterium]|nr:50S ribosomal protein L10 [Acidimicrobiales bacterium]
MENPRPEKVAVVAEVRQRLEAAEAAILTEYRGLTVADLATLRQALQAAGGDYKIYKNTLVKLAVDGGRHQALAPLLQGPTAIAFVTGEVSAVAKALRDYARTSPNLVIKGGMHGEGVLSPQDLAALADLPSREVLLAQVAGALAAPMRQLAGLLQALPRNLAYGLSALLDQRGGAPETDAPEADAPEAGAPEAGAGPADAPVPADASASGDAPAAAAPAEGEPAAEAPPSETPAEAPPAEVAAEDGTPEAPEG